MNACYFIGIILVNRLNHRDDFFESIEPFSLLVNVIEGVDHGVQAILCSITKVNFSVTVVDKLQIDQLTMRRSSLPL